jgi:hypothetical protein
MPRKEHCKPEIFEEIRAIAKLPAGGKRLYFTRPELVELHRFLLKVTMELNNLKSTVAGENHVNDSIGQTM